MKRSALKRKATWKPLKKISRHRLKDIKIYTGLRLKFLSENHICFVCRKRGSTQIHHMRGRRAFLNDVRYFCATCSYCHNRITYNPKWAYDNGYSVDRLTHE